MKKISVLLLLVLSLATLTACAPGSKAGLEKNDSQIQLTVPGPNPEQGKPAENGSVAGLGTGLWHGLISVFTLIMSFINPDYQMYEVHNTGPMYNLGYLLGAVLLFAILAFTGGRRG